MGRSYEEVARQQPPSVATVRRMPVEPPPSPWAFPTRRRDRPRTTWSAVGADLEPGHAAGGLPARDLPDAVGGTAGRRWPGGRPVQPGRPAARWAAGRRARCGARAATSRSGSTPPSTRWSPRCADPRRAGGWIDRRHRGGVRAAARARLGPLGRGLARRRARRRAVRRRDRRAVRGGVDVPPRAGRLEGGAGRRWSTLLSTSTPTRRLLDVQWVTPHLASSAWSRCRGRSTSGCSSGRCGSRLGVAG